MVFLKLSHTLILFSCFPATGRSHYRASLQHHEASTPYTFAFQEDTEQRQKAITKTVFAVFSNSATSLTISQLKLAADFQSPHSAQPSCGCIFSLYLPLTCLLPVVLAASIIPTVCQNISRPPAGLSKGAQNTFSKVFSTAVTGLASVVLGKAWKCPHLLTSTSSVLWNQ